LRDVQGRIYAIGSVSTDVTEQRRMERENSQLEISVRAAREASRLKSEFLANMSHEIRTPLNAVIGMIDLLAASELSPKQRDWAETIRRSADSLMFVINDILDFSKIEAGKVDMEQVPFRLDEALEAVTRSFQYAAQEK